MYYLKENTKKTFLEDGQLSRLFEDVAGELFHCLEGTTTPHCKILISDKIDFYEMFGAYLLAHAELLATAKEDEELLES